MDNQYLLASHLESPTMKNHRRQSFWQILFPIILAAVVVIAASVLVMLVTGGRGNFQDTHWANISLIWLIIPVLASSLIFLALTIALVVLLAKLLGVLPKYGALGQYYADRMALLAQSYSDKITKPVLAAGGATAGTKTFFSRLRQKIREIF